MAPPISHSDRILHGQMQYETTSIYTTAVISGQDTDRHRYVDTGSISSNTGTCSRAGHYSLSGIRYVSILSRSTDNNVCHVRGDCRNDKYTRDHRTPRTSVERHDAIVLRIERTLATRTVHRVSFATATYKIFVTGNETYG